MAIDAGSLTSGLDLSAQFRLQACIISHAHLDHIRDLATIADNRFQADCEPLIVAATRATISSLKKHFFNNLLWPDFSTIPNKARPTILFHSARRVIRAESPRIGTSKKAHKIHYVNSRGTGHFHSVTPADGWPADWAGTFWWHATSSRVQLGRYRSCGMTPPGRPKCGTMSGSPLTKSETNSRLLLE